MLIDIPDPETLGALIRATRKLQKVRMDDLAGTGGSPVFVRDVERGKPTAQIGRVMRLMEELGIRLKAEASEEAIAAYEASLGQRGKRRNSGRAK